MSNIYKKSILLLLVSINLVSLSNAQGSTHSVSRTAIYQAANINNSGLFLPTTPFGIATLIFMLIMAVAFGITRLKGQQDSSNQLSN